MGTAPPRQWRATNSQWTFGFGSAAVFWTALALGTWLFFYFALGRERDEVFCLAVRKAGVVDGPPGLADPQSLAIFQRYAARMQPCAVGVTILIFPVMAYFLSCPSDLLASAQ
jgi:hypothetical protein